MDGDRNCNLLRNLGTNTILLHNHISGPKTCGCFRESYSFNGNTIRTISSKSTFNCQHSCNNYDGCNYFTHNWATRMCYFKGDTSVPSGGANVNETSGPTR